MSSLDLSVIISGQALPVADSASLPSVAPVGSYRCTLDDGHLWLYTTSGWTDISSGGGGGGVTGGSNVGGGAGVFKDVLLGSTMRFKTLTNTDGFIGFTVNANTIAINLTSVIPISAGGTGQSNQQAALNNLTNIGGATNGDILQYIGGNAQFAAPPAPTYAQINSALGLPANCFLAANASNEVVGYGEWGLDETTKFSNAQLFYQPNNLGAGPTSFTWNVNVAPQQDSPNDSLIVHNISANLDSSANGFDMGTSGNAVTLLNAGFNYGGNGSTYGRLIYQNWNTGFGNGTDPIEFKGLSGSFVGFTTNPNVTVSGGYTAYSSQVQLDVSTVTTSQFSFSVLVDNSQLPVDVYGFTGVSLAQTISKLKDTHNYNGFIVNPTITEMDGNASFYGSLIQGTITTQGTNGYFGQQINPNIVHLTSNSFGQQISGQTTDGTAEWTGQFISTNQINTTDTVRALQIATPANSGHKSIDADGHAAISVDFEVANGLGQAFGHNLGGSVSIPDGTAITSTDVFGNGLAFGVDLGDSGSSFTSSSPVGLTSVGFVGQVVGDGTADLINFLLNGYAGQFNGNIARINNAHFACFPNAGTGVLAESVLCLASQPAGPVGTDNWGFRAENSHLENYMPKLALSTADFKVSADSLLGLGDQSLLSGDNHANIRNARAKTDPSGYAVDCGYSCINAATFTDNSATAIVGSHVTAKVIVAAGKTIGGLVGMFNPVGRADAGDDGTVPLALGYHTSFASGNSATKVTSLWASYFTGFHSIDANANQIGAMYDFYAQASSIGAGAVTTRYGIVIEPDAGYVKTNWLSGQLSVGGSSAAPTNSDVGVEIKTGMTVVASYDNAGEGALAGLNGSVIYNTDLNKFRGYENGAWVNLV